MGSRRSSILRWYPKYWRERHGAELSAFLDDEFGHGSLPFRAAMSVIRGGLAQRARVVVGPAVGMSASNRAQGEMATILWSWALVVLAGCAFQKSTEHVAGGAPALALVVAAAVVGGALVLIAGIVATPSTWRAVHAREQGAFSAPLSRAAAVSVVTAALTVGLVTWAHRLDAAQRNGGSSSYLIMFVIWAIAVACTILAWTSVASVAAHVVELHRRPLLVAMVCAFGVVGAAVLVLSGVVVWWASAVGPRSEVTLACIVLLLAAAALMAVRSAMRLAHLAHTLSA